MKLLHRLKGMQRVTGKREKTRFSYQAFGIAVTEVRVLTLKSGPWSHPIACELKCIPLDGDNVDPYWALSYCWGDTNDLVEIELNGLIFEVTRGLASALRHLRHSTDDRVLWVDAICINQKNTPEKNEQVRKMQKIYQCATRVVAWLGEESHDSNEAMALMQDLGKWFMDWVDRAEENEDNSLRVTTQIMREEGFNPDGRNWKALRNLWNREYWSRIWIIQEIAAAREDVHDFWFKKGQIVCGQVVIPLQYFTSSCALLRSFLKNPAHADVATGQTTIEEPVKSMQSMPVPRAIAMGMVVQMACSSRPHSIVTLLGATTSFQATKMVDKIFPLLAFASDAYGFLPNYELTPQEAFEGLARYHIQQTETLQVLLGNRNVTGVVVGAPSWVPEPYGLQRIANHSRSWWYWYMNGYAAGGLPAQVTFEEEKKLLRAAGLRVGKVDRVIGPFPEFSIPQGDGDVMNFVHLGETIGWASPMYELSALGRSLEGDQLESYWRTLVLDVDRADITEDDSRAKPADRVFGEYVNLWLQSTVVLHTRDEADIMALQRDTNRIMPLVTQVEENVINQTIFTTDTGFIGMGPLHCKPGDIAAVLFGSPMCLILRPEGEQYRLIGDSYIQGLMRGEWVQVYYEGGSEAEIFDIL